MKSDDLCEGLVRVISVLVVAVLTTTDAFAAETLTLEGKAFALDSERPVYTEKHQLTEESDGLWVMRTEYLTPSGEPFAERTVRFQSGALATPSYELIDYRDGFKEGARLLEGDKVELYRVIGGQEERQTIEVPNNLPLVIDAGFSALIEQNWEALLSGKRVQFEFASSARLTTVPFRLTHLGKTEVEGFPVEKLMLEPANWFVRMLVPAIELEYHSENRTLIGYTGLSNVRKEEGGNHSVRIAFPPDHQFTMRQLPSGLRHAVP